MDDTAALLLALVGVELKGEGTLAWAEWRERRVGEVIRPGKARRHLKQK